jgi:hypothetical protein
MAVSFQKTIPILRIFGVEKAKELYVDYLGLVLLPSSVSPRPA